ncbi:hypothetical protein PAXRUDRAFT_835684 [Paxillus rubicundulus Ve08.2h10]|uniref:HTH CENPB-type domain-containing protein n=1 Tax=Paxillus rubicundulus Ve08.2h10 TaxID=930991 RepID=A0A0D0CJR8_9AGAM|nr:hypothetical protein PAXRUDRAFT_835684 [Paxillus rubicundulus Ve08.2h10]
MALVRLCRTEGNSGRRGKLHATSDPTYESRINAAIQGLANGLYKTLAAAARDQNVSCQTLSDRHQGTHQSRAEAQAKMQILTPTQEEVLVDWCKMASSSATPLHPSRLCAHVKALTGRLPSRNWHHYFLCHHNSLFITRPHGLDPKCAQNFNRETISEFFEMRR